MLGNEKVVHIKFGSGTIIEENDKHIRVQFDSADGDKLFIYPDAFEKYLQFNNKAMQTEAEKQIETIKKEHEENRKEKLRLYEEEQKRLRLEKVKSTKKASSTTRKKKIVKPEEVEAESEE